MKCGIYMWLAEWSLDAERPCPARVARHLASCAECRERWNALSRVDRTLLAAAGARDDGVDPGWHDRTLRAVRAQRDPIRTAPARIGAPRLALAGLAALLLAVLAWFGLHLSGPGTQSPPGVDIRSVVGGVYHLDARIHGMAAEFANTAGALLESETALLAQDMHAATDFLLTCL